MEEVAFLKREFLAAARGVVVEGFDYLKEQEMSVASSYQSRCLRRGNEGGERVGAFLRSVDRVLGGEGGQRVGSVW